MNMTRRTITEVLQCAAPLWEKAKRRADSEWGPACPDAIAARGIATTLGKGKQETFSIDADPGMRRLSMTAP